MAGLVGFTFYDKKNTKEAEIILQNCAAIGNYSLLYILPIFFLFQTVKCFDNLIFLASSNTKFSAHGSV